MRLLHVLSAASLSWVLLAPDVVGQSYPVKSVRVIVPTAAGGNPDFIIRPVVQKMSESLKQQFVVDNRPGASGIIGVELAARAPADGYTLLFAAIGHLATPPALYDKLPYDAVKDFAPVSNLVDTPFVLFVHPSVPAKTVKEFVALAKARPGQITYMSFGVGSFPQFLTELFSAMTGVKLLHVPYKGSAPAASALLAGEVMSGFDAMQTAMSLVRAKRLRALAIGAEQRSPIAPEIPTFAEAGFPGAGGSAWFGLLAPANTPRDIVMKLNAEVVKALATPEIRQIFEPAGMHVVASTPEQFAALLRRDIDKFVKIAREAGIRGE
jgi:tripartite-type tricarboxylate transporter receptor subunit TctC